MLSRSNQGILIAVDKYIINKNGDIFNKKTLKQKKLRIMYKSASRGKYYAFGVRVNKTMIPVTVHRFQAYIKYGDIIFNNGIVVRHLNNNSLDNTWNNIDIGTYRDNSLDMPKEKRIKLAINASYVNRSFTDEIVKNIYIDRQSKMTYKQLCVKYNTSKSTLSFLFNKSLYLKNIINNQ